MELSDYGRIVFRRWRWIALAMVGALAIAVLLTAMTTREYRAQAQLFVSTSASGDASDLVQGGSFTQRQVATYAGIITTRAVLEPVIERLDLGGTPRELAERTVATVPPDTVLINVAVTDPDPERAAATANAIAEQFTNTVQDLERVTADGTSPVKATVVEPAVPPSGPSSPNPPRNLALGVVAGLLLGMGAAVLRDRLDTRIRHENDVLRVTELPTLGAIPFDADATRHPLVLEIDPNSSRAEALRTMRTNLQFLDADQSPRTILVTSTVPGEGKSSTSANLALTLAESGAKVCLIEGDLRRPGMLNYLSLENAAGLTTVLIGQAELDDVMQHYRAGLHVLGCGPIPPNPSELLGSVAMRNLLQRLKSEYDYVIVDSPPLLPVTDAAVMATQVDGTLVVVGAGVVKRDSLAKALGGLAKVDARILGLVLNRLPTKGFDVYRYAYDSYAAEPPTRRRRSTSPRPRRRVMGGTTRL